MDDQYDIPYLGIDWFNANPLQKLSVYLIWLIYLKWLLIQKKKENELLIWIYMILNSDNLAINYMV